MGAGRDLKKGKELLSTNWRMDERKKRLRGGGRVVRMTMMTVRAKTIDIIWTSTMMWRSCLLDWIMTNLRDVTGLDSEMEEESAKGDEDDEEDDGGGEKGDDEDNEVDAENEKQPAERRSKRNKVR